MSPQPSISWLAQAGRALVSRPLDALLIMLPVAWGMHYFEVGDLWIFIASAVAIIPLAGLMGRATESLAVTLGDGVGGLLNATFGNAAELIIALMALRHGPDMYPLVKASITGSIIGNVLLVLGLSMFAGGLRYKFQRFNRTAASMGATLLTLATVGLIMPTLYFYVFAANTPLQPEQLSTVESLSEEIAVILAVVYLLSLVFTFVTHRSIFDVAESPEVSATARSGEAAPEPHWSRTTSLTVLLASTAAIAVVAEMLVGSVEAAAHAFDMSRVFVGVIVVAVIGNAAEHSTAILMAMKNKMDLAVNVAVGSGIQIALFVAPVLVFSSMVMGHDHPLDLHFTPMEIVAVTISIAVLAIVAQDGESHWFEGVMLLAVYAILALAFYHLGDMGPARLADG
ncbi:MAG: calcium/proton exchanger [Planctomycetaceae bacterium]|nr:calcium/proton exchanger [Planctomycetaceae bacterium]